MSNNKHNNTESQKGNYEKSLDNAINYLDDYLVSHEPDSDHYEELSQLHLWLLELRELRSDAGKIKAFGGVLKLIEESPDPEFQRALKQSERKNEEILKYVKSMNEKKKSLKETIDKYAELGFNLGQIKQIRLGLKVGLDVSIYAKPEFDNYQMEQIRLGLLRNIDVSIYAKPEFDCNQMRRIRHKLEL